MPDARREDPTPVVHRHHDVELEPRRRPVQERSRDRFARILRSTRDLLLETGIEALSCESIAIEAGVPVGTVYQFFPNKFSIVCELDRIDTESVAAELDAFASQIPSLEWQQLLDALIDHLAKAWAVDPSRRAVWLSMQAIPPTREAATRHQQILGDRVARIISPLTPGMHRRERSTIAQVVVHTCYSMLNFSVRDHHAHPAAVRETKRLLTSYLVATATSASI
ncbi:MAG TPA: TetR/AcrR family transcriptional regulator [Microthrixaceae bacterium]|nr:TetR family transcriptional regulator [Microthrixaceae bacterium]HNI34563.1 TetR/AcrR family transcriptional regulator [Microthrixaceae bacterium]